MFHQIFSRPCTIQRHQTGPLAELRLAWLEHCVQRGLSQSTLRRIALHLFRACRLLDLTSESQMTCAQIQEEADRWIHRSHPHRNLKHARDARRLFVQDVTNWLNFVGLLQPPLRVVETVLASKGRDAGYGRRTLQGYSSALRVFLRYTEMRGFSPQDVADRIMAPQIWKDESLPAAPSWDDVQRLLTQVDQDHPTAIRDRALILLLAVYGLRSCEVRQLQLEHLDWDRGMIAIQRSKLGPRQEFPLVPTVGEAIIRYLREVRPRVAWREVFLSFHPPYHPLSSSAVYKIVGPRLKALGLELRRHGPHTLRHACATHLLTQGCSLKEIGDYLGHRHPDSTRIYAKVNMALLREVANLELGGVL